MDAELKAIYDKYAKADEDYTALATSKTDTQKDEINKQFNSAMADSYVSYMQAQKALPAMLQNFGGTGVSETTALAATTDYQNRNKELETNKNTNITNLDIALNDMLKEWRLENEMNKNSELQAQQQIIEDRYANTISGYDSLAEIDKAMKTASDWEKKYLEARRTELLAQGLGSSGGSGGSSYSSGGGSSSGGSSSSSNKTTGTLSGIAKPLNPIVTAVKGSSTTKKPTSIGDIVNMFK